MGPALALFSGYRGGNTRNTMTGRLSRYNSNLGHPPFGFSISVNTHCYVLLVGFEENGVTRPLVVSEPTSLHFYLILFHSPIVIFF